jgi:anti-anti-sigma factor
MDIQDLFEDIILVHLPRKRQALDELQRAIEMVHERGDCNMVVDFSNVDIIGCATLTRLIELRQLLQNHGRKLVLCSVAPATRRVFTITQLDEVFDFVQDKHAAMAHLKVVV